VSERAPLSAYLRKHASYLALVVIVMTIPTYLRDSYYLDILAFVGTRFMMVMGLSLLVGQAGQISLGQAGFVGIGAYGAAILTTRVGLDPWAAMVLAALIAAVIAALVGIPALKLKGYYLAMATLGVNEIIYILIVQLKGLTEGTDPMKGIPSLSIGGLDLGAPRAFHLVVWGVALLMFRAALNISKSRVGRSLRALRQSEVAAESLGVETSYRRVQVFVLAAVFASVAGSFDAYHTSFAFPENYTISFSIILITGVIIGGLGTVWGALWGAVVIQVLPELLNRMGAKDYTHLVFGVLLVIMVLWRGRVQGLRRTLKAWTTDRTAREAPPPHAGE
jgi:branched-chain amino acid transport system permease protein